MTCQRVVIAVPLLLLLIIGLCIGGTRAVLCADALTTCNAPATCCCDPLLFCTCCTVTETCDAPTGVCSTAVTPTPSTTSTPTLTASPSTTPTATLSASPSFSSSPSTTSTATLSASPSLSSSPSRSTSSSLSSLPSTTPSATLSASPSRSLSASVTSAVTTSASPSFSSSASVSSTSTYSAGPSTSASASTSTGASTSATLSSSSSATPSRTSTPTTTITRSATFTLTPTPTLLASESTTPTSSSPSPVPILVNDELSCNNGSIVGGGGGGSSAFDVATCTSNDTTLVLYSSGNNATLRNTTVVLSQSTVLVGSLTVHADATLVLVGNTDNAPLHVSNGSLTLLDGTTLHVQLTGVAQLGVLVPLVLVDSGEQQQLVLGDNVTVLVDTTQLEFDEPLRACERLATSVERTSHSLQALFSVDSTRCSADDAASKSSSSSTRVLAIVLGVCVGAACLCVPLVIAMLYVIVWRRGHCWGLRHSIDKEDKKIARAHGGGDKHGQHSSAALSMAEIAGSTSRISGGGGSPARMEGHRDPANAV